MSKLIYSKTDQERRIILKAFYDRPTTAESEESLFTEDQILKIDKYFKIFEKLKIFDDFVNSEKEKEDKEFNDLFIKAKIFVLHYYQTIQMGIERGELPSSILNFYGLSYPFTLPEINNGEELLSVSQTLFASDSIRVGTGGKYFANPSIGAVKVWVEKFTEVWEKKTNKFNVKKAAVENIENIRLETDKLILELHKLLDNQFSVIDYDEQITLFEEYGMTIEPGINENFIEPEELLQEDSDPNNQKKDSKNNAGTSNMNQLKFDLFFPER